MTLLSHALAESEPSPEPPSMPETDAARQTTHWVGCEQAHHACALAKLERVTAERDALEAACIDFLAASSEVPTVAPRLRQALDAAGVALTVRDSLREGD